MTTTWDGWKTNHNTLFGSITFIEKDLQSKEKGSSNWLRVNCIWEERSEGTQTKKHTYCLILDNTNGNLYLDVSQKKLVVKFLTLSLIRVFHATLKIFYHIALPISIPIEIFKAYSQAASEAKEKSVSITYSRVAYLAIRNVSRSILDIVRTPLYNIAMIFLMLAGIPSSPNYRYEIMKIVGLMEINLTWANSSDPLHSRISFWTLAGCLQPMANLQDFGCNPDPSRHPDTKYENQVSKGDKFIDLKIRNDLANFARSQIVYLREGKRLFEGCQQLPKDVVYASTAMLR